jgi:threonylcarbamoyladenosine tRNA methylthiotransferase MtaB
VSPLKKLLHQKNFILLRSSAATKQNSRRTFMKFYIQTFGCKVNLYESKWMQEYLENCSYTYSESPDDCDIIIVNSCTVTSSGDSRVLSCLKKFRKSNPHAILILSGCYSQTHKDNLNEIDADIIIGTKNRKAVNSYIVDFLTSHQKIIDISDYSKNDEFEDMSCNEFGDHTRAFVKIQDGCNQFCSYCAIPFARGRCRSKSPDALREELSLIAQKGYKEVVLCGINLAFWGMEWNLHLRDAVEIAANINGIERIRLGSLEPERITDEDLDYFASLSKFCPQFHLSLQSGCDETLKRMNRKYTTAEYLTLCEKIKSRFKYAAITTDIMVGFPAETDEEFNTTIEFVKKVGFAKVHVFRYSRRKGTVADKMTNQIPESVKSERSAKLTETVSALQKNFNKSLVGAVLPVLFERQTEKDFLCGHAPNGVVIKISSKSFKKGLRNSIFYVTIVDSNDNFCFGKIQSEISI